MKRRQFITSTALTATAFSTSGFIRFNGKFFEGDCETTTDILGPFYRPDSPVRTNLVIPGESGLLVELSGTIKHNDCVTPYKNAKIELWHCDGEGVYDNDTEAYRYRATSYCNEEGEYSFNTILPVPYDAGGGNFRPAHFHMMITAEGYQSLVTQLYFTGDEYIDDDMSASAPTAKQRILEVQDKGDGSKKVTYHVTMAKKLLAEASVLKNLAGVYINEDDNDKKTELFVKDNVLWMKGNPYGNILDYVGNNTFRLPGLPNNMSLEILFEPLQSGSVKMTGTFTNAQGEKDIRVAMKQV
jgi:protocatechuate 3,4-dioxygenase beta subunit